LRGCTIQEVGGEMMMGSSIYGVAVIDGSLYSRVYGIYGGTVWRCWQGSPGVGEPVVKKGHCDWWRESWAYRRRLV